MKGAHYVTRRGEVLESDAGASDGKFDMDTLDCYDAIELCIKMEKKINGITKGGRHKLVETKIVYDPREDSWRGFMIFEKAYD